MKKLFLTLAFIMLSVFAAFADSPLTSTNFYMAYLDVPVVKQASQSNGVMNDEIIKFVGSDRNPVDVRLAVVNALGFGKPNAEKFGEYLCDKYDVNMDKLFQKLSPEMTMVLAYIMAMEEYADYEKLSISLTVAQMSFSSYDIPKVSILMVYGLIKSQIDIRGGMKDVKRAVYQASATNFVDLEQDLRPGAAEIIWDYMRLYDCATINITNSSKNPYIIKVNGKLIGVVQGEDTMEYPCEKNGYYHIEATQKSGYAFYPTINNRDVNVEAIQDYYIYVGSEN